MSRISEEKKKHKKKLEKLNQMQLELFYFLRLRRTEDARIRGEEEEKKSKAARKEDKKLDDKVATIRNRVTGQKRISRERWNRFAGTGESGGRGL
jgi:hypothetical protein